MRSFQVFHSYPGQPHREGGVFHLYEARETLNSELAEDSGQYDPLNASIHFTNRGQTFQFCGAGAMALAHHLQHHPDLQNAWQPIQCGNGSYLFEVGVWQQQACVRLSPATASGHRHSILQFNDCYLFDRESVFAAPMPLNTLANFNADNDFLRHLQEQQLSALLYSVNLKQLNVWFRYFTGFNGKGEDQATGSAFRYLHNLLPKQNTVFHATQLSAKGASMVFEMSGPHMIYWGNISKLPPAATQPCRSEMHN